MEYPSPVCEESVHWCVPISHDFACTLGNGCTRQITVIPWYGVVMSAVGAVGSIHGYPDPRPGCCAPLLWCLN